MKHPSVLVFMFCAVCLVAFVPMVSAGTDQINTVTEYPIDDYFTPANYPCLVETIHVTGTLLERLHVVFNPNGGYSWQVQQSPREMTAVGLTTGRQYAFSGPLSYAENGYVDPCDCNLYPLEWTLHNIIHFVGPSGLPNFYLRQVIHLTYDRTTGETKAEVVKDEILCH